MVSKFTHFRHLQRLFLTEKIIVCKISAIRGSSIKDVLPNKKNANLGSEVTELIPIVLQRKKEIYVCTNLKSIIKEYF